MRHTSKRLALATALLATGVAHAGIFGTTFSGLVYFCDTTNTAHAVCTSSVEGEIAFQPERVDIDCRIELEGTEVGRLHNISYEIEGPNRFPYSISTDVPAPLRSERVFCALNRDRFYEETLNIIEFLGGSGTVCKLSPPPPSPEPPPFVE